MIAGTYSKIRAYARRDRRRRALVIGLAAVAAVAVLAFVTIYREAIIQGVVGIGLVGLMIVGFLRGGLSSFSDHSSSYAFFDDDEDGFRDGWQGPGAYMGGWRIDSDE